MSLNTFNIRYLRRMPHLCTFSIMKCYFNKIFHLSIAHRRDHSWGIRWIFVVLSCLFLMINAHPQQVKQCTSLLPTAGWTEPQGDIIVKYGDNMQIWCHLNEMYVARNYPGLNSSNIYFMSGFDKVEQKFITIINKTTALLTIKSPPAGHCIYFCNLDIPNNNDKAICRNTVFVISEPQPPRNFTCRLYDRQNLTCTWKVSKTYIPTTYTLFFQDGQQLVPCPIIEMNNSCTWTLHTYPMYRESQKQYKFVMQIQNMFDNKIFTYKIDHNAIVIPAKLVNLAVTDTTSNSAMLCWEFGFAMKNFPAGLTFKIAYQNQWDYEKNWEVITIITEPSFHLNHFNLNELLYANTAYNARVYYKNAEAVGEDMYSEPAVVTFKTLPTLPSFPPRTDIGSFEIIENHESRDVYLYWQMIQQRYENGYKFKYRIIYVEENGQRIDLEPIEMTKAYAKFERLNFTEYRFKIVSENEIGISENYTEIIVPSRNEMAHGPIEITKMAFEKGLYELSWVTSNRDKKYVRDYTIFWCNHERDRPYQCSGYLNWTHVSMNTTVYNITVPDSDKIYQFAISTNTNKGSSGMKWSPCTVIRSNELKKIDVVWVNRVDIDFIEVGWYLDCSDRIGIIEEIKIYYCPVVVVVNIKCIEPVRIITVKYHPYKQYGIVDNLMPNTLYMLQLTMMTKYGETPFSAPLYQVTQQNASCISC